MFRAILRTKQRAPHSEFGALAVLGLSAENLLRLQGGEPIHVRLEDLGEIPDGISPRDVAIMVTYGETEEAIAREFQTEARRALQGRMVRR
jgi:hypothetical protein